MNRDEIIQALEAEISRLTQARDLLRENSREPVTKRAYGQRRKENGHCAKHPEATFTPTGLCKTCRNTASQQRYRKGHPSPNPRGRPRKQLECMDCRGKAAHQKYPDKASLDQHRKVEHGWINGRPVPEIEEELRA